jgi:hypothetical protein
VTPETPPSPTAPDPIRRGLLVSGATGVVAGALAMAWPVPACATHQAALSLRVVTPPPAKAISYDAQGLEALGVTGLTTAVPWDSQPRYWEGVTLRRLVTAVRAVGHSLLVKALNGYAAHIPWSDLERYNPLLAWLRDGQRIPIRAKGPLIVIYPFTDRPELRGDIYNGRSVWHVSEIVAE